MKKIVFATSNQHKLEELQAICKNRIDVEFVLPPKAFDPVENGETFEQNSLIKAREAARLSGLPALADDSGLCVDALDGAPGIHSARYAQTPQQRIDKLLKALDGIENRKAKFVCAMTLVNPQGDVILQETGECHGEIAYTQKGEHGFGYDPIFVVLDKNMTMAELEENEKNKISHRAIALRKIIVKLQKKSKKSLF